MGSARRSSTALLRSRRPDSLELTASSVNLCSDTGPTSSRRGQCRACIPDMCQLHFVQLQLQLQKYTYAYRLGCHAKPDKSFIVSVFAATIAATVAPCTYTTGDRRGDDRL